MTTAHQRRPAPGRRRPTLGRHRPRRMVGRQRPGLQRLPRVGVRVRGRRLRRARDRPARPRVARAPAGRIRFMVTGALAPDSPIAEHVRAHGDGVRDICFLVDDAEAAYAAALDRGARPERPPAVDTDEHRRDPPRRHPHLRRDGAHVPRPQRLRRRVRPGVRAAAAAAGRRARRSASTRFDHVVGNVEKGHLDEWVDYYQRGARLRPARPLRRRPDLHRVLGADVDGRVEPRQGRAAHQRAGRRAAQEPDRGVPRLLRGAGRAAHGARTRPTSCAPCGRCASAACAS